MDYSLVAIIWLAVGVILVLALQGVGVADLWTVILALATFGLALVSYQQVRTSALALGDSLRPFLIWDGYWQAENSEERTILVKNIGRTPATMVAVEHIVDGATHRREGSWSLGPHSTGHALEVKCPYGGTVVVQYEGPSGKRYDLRDCLGTIIVGAEAKPRGFYPAEPGRKPVT